MKLPASQVDPAWPAAPDFDAHEQALLDALSVPAAPSQTDLIERERAALRHRVADLQLQALRLQVQLHQARRQQRAQPAPCPPPQTPINGRGRPHQYARNDRLLALFEQTPYQLPHLQRCRMAAQALAVEVTTTAGLPIGRARVLPVTTARDAIAEALRRRRG
ncbi:MAG TPA: hypothetical protein VN680_06340 [Burkholderiaceae bacterium]|nr:hypothetical protein [Burkholderiaceae bacterium]